MSCDLSYPSPHPFVVHRNHFINHSSGKTAVFGLYLINLSSEYKSSKYKYLYLLLKLISYLMIGKSLSLLIFVLSCTYQLIT